ncbi:response regulator transcription factor [Paraburkholderia sp. J76]|uniref:response regulator transcription factor n=1 Tax=Paraburkholderia sp. J76 TaxID=2805439 RepID=UPI002ABDDDF5|nr:LuxR C-terminal-related transcriptional regulator [Paraburkholderia sp. J76]
MSKPARTTVYVIDDDDAWRSELNPFLRDSGYCVFHFATMEQAWLQAFHTGRGCIFLNVGADECVLGLEFRLARIRALNGLPVVVTSSGGDVATVVKAMRAGAVDFLQKPIDPHIMLRSLDAALNSTRQASPRVALANLNERERIVLTGILAGQKNREIAQQLDVSERTIKYCRSAIRCKLKVASLVELFRFAGRAGDVGEMATVIPVVSEVNCNPK